MYGGGNIGRGFIGAALSEAGYNVTFIDVAENVVKLLNERGSYPVRFVGDFGRDEILIKNVDCVNGRDASAAARAIADADIMATAVGADILKFIAPNIAEGLKLRFMESDKPLDIIICENLMDANKELERLIKQYLTSDEQKLMDARVGLVEASIGRMVPVQTDEMREGDPLRVTVERYGYLPVDKDAFKGAIPEIKNLIPASPFDFYIKRKLFLHNMGHAVCAYLGGIKGIEYIWQALDDPEIQVVTQNAMIESATALSREYGFPLDGLLLHMRDLLTRFRNAALKDTCLRVGASPTRKLKPADRLVGAALLETKQGVIPAYTCAGIAAALYRLLKESEREISAENAQAALSEISGLPAGSEISDYVLDIFKHIAGGEDIANVRRAAERIVSRNKIDVV